MRSLPLWTTPCAVAQANPDTTLAPGALAVLLATLDAQPEAGMNERDPNRSGRERREAVEGFASFFLNPSLLFKVNELGYLWSLEDEIFSKILVS